jgi:glycosyltransferase involved in cell wall biosynthesis
MHMMLLATDPLVLLTTTTNIVEIPGAGISTLDALELMSESLSCIRKPYCLVQPTWHFRDIISDSPETISHLLRASASWGSGHVIILENEPEDRELAQRLGLGSCDVHQNAFISERLYFPDEHVSQIFDAIYNARLFPFKRHYLAKDVNNLALIYAPSNDLMWCQYVKEVLPTATYLNGDPNSPHDYKKFSPREIAERIRQSKVGLCLSEVEGAMYASMEYLLCGVPVVSTSEKGGRSVFANSNDWFTCDDTPEAVSEAVLLMIKSRRSPKEIAERAMADVRLHRERFVDLMHRLQLDNGLNPVWHTNWNFLSETFGGLRHCSFLDIKNDADRLRSNQNFDSIFL